ncbi:MAG: lytic murein transglycosylase [Proteobacteria bacterium]|nr:lytic murein transglycosylase [Pseudomonadota bacterium]
MTRHRLFVWSSLLLLAGCASSIPSAPPPMQTSSPPLPPREPAPPPRPATGYAQAPAPSGDMAFDAWRSDFLRRAPADVRTILVRELAGLTPDARVLTSDLGQPEFSRPVGDYIQRTVGADRIALGRQARERVPALSSVEARYGVPAEIVTAIWGMETAFGKIKGDQDVIRSLATLAAQGRRREWAETQLIATARMIARGDATRAQLRGSWAGAMGHTQFIPETYLRLAVDGDGDGDRDIWNSETDALHSAANLLSNAGWKRGGSWAVEVLLPPGFDYSVSETVALRPTDWAARGVRRADGRPWSSVDADSDARLILPAGARGPAFLTFPNHMAIRAYNNSTSYALAVGLIADGLRGTPPLRTSWPAEQPMSLADRRAVQAALTQLGFDVGAIDGVIGAGTRAAVRNWQKSRGRPADGYVDAATVAALKAEARL